MLRIRFIYTLLLSSHLPPIVILLFSNERVYHLTSCSERGGSISSAFPVMDVVSVLKDASCVFFDVRERGRVSVAVSPSMIASVRES